MHPQIKIAAAFVAGSLLAGGGAIAATSSNEVAACVDSKTRVMKLAPKSGKCPAGSSKLAWGITGPQGPAGPSTPSRSFDATALARQLLPSVVTVLCEFPDGSSTGSGFITTFPTRADDNNSYIVTNNHVVEDATKITIEFDDGSELPGQLVGADPIYDVAVVMVKKAGLPAVTLGDSTRIAIGSPVLAIGSPLGLNGSVSTGIVSGLNRPVSTAGTRTDTFINAVQTDAAINPGNSGGPLVDADGAVIGINAAIATLDTTGQQTGSIGLGFAIPIKQAYRIASELASTATILDGTVMGKGHSTRPLLGVTFEDLPTGGGAKVVAVTPGGAADLAGITPGMIVHKIGSRIVKDMLTAVVTIGAYEPGAIVTISAELPAGGGTQTFTVTLGSAQSN
jgi:putative serine protease PepD